MVLGARRSAFNLSPQAQLQAYISYDPVSRRKVRFIETIVPVLSSDEDILADLYYADWGASIIPEWANSTSGTPTYENWDATEQRFYCVLDSSTDSVWSTARNAWPTGVKGTAQSFTPKNVDVTKCAIQFRAKFTQAAGDYRFLGVGLNSRAAAVAFNTATDHFINLYAYTSVWYLATSDGSTISTTTGGATDASWHDFRIEWELTEVRLYIDDSLEITKSTNLPTQPLAFRAISQGATNQLHIMGTKISWV